MTLVQIAGLIYQVLIGQLSIQGLLVRLADTMHNAAREHAEFQIESTVTNTQLAVQHPTSGLANAYAQARTDTGTIMAAIGAITPTPAAPPPSADDNALAVWSRADPNSPGAATPYGDEQYEPYARALAMNNGGAVAVAASIHFTAYGYFGSIHAAAELADPPLPDWSAILESDTRLTWLTRTETRFTWAEDVTTHIITGFRTIGTGTITFTFDLSEAEFNEIATLGIAGPPVWPGIANVTLGTPVALGDNVTVPGPLDGLLIAVTTPPSGLGKFVMGGRTWWYRAGQLTFVSDNGDVEPWQYLTWDQGLYVPRAMARADSAILRALAGIGGTATPWTSP